MLQVGIMSVKQWVTRTNSKGIVAKTGRYGGIYAYKDIAFEKIRQKLVNASMPRSVACLLHPVSCVFLSLGIC